MEAHGIVGSSDNTEERENSSTSLCSEGVNLKLHECDSSYKFLPSKEDWQHIQCVADCLKVFYEVTKRVSGTKYPTLSLYFNDFCGIYLLLREWQFNVDTFVASMAVPMVDKFEKYWDIANKLLEIAIILDSRYKMKSIEYYYKLLYDPFVADLRIESARKSFLELFNEYASQPSQASSDGNSSRNLEAAIPSSTQSSSSLFAIRLGLENFIYESNSSHHSKSELEIYLEDPSSPGIGNCSFDILAWWRVNGPKYPIISRMARDVLSVPLSTVAFESIFSSAKRILDDYRCNLLPETIEAIMCSHDWLKGRIPGVLKVTYLLLNQLYQQKVKKIKMMTIKDKVPIKICRSLSALLVVWNRVQTYFYVIVYSINGIKGLVNAHIMIVHFRMSCFTSASVPL
ncbi:zinc finger BED domain-containing protein RICESLEEPER 1-like isoform X2 [Panicum virgatum]|uniref:zinc finger BED domain-containing protein RICESLEEPER 1-like isoform X2 n=1 Tax=Panicum virgatum TaxID=38727 RepID=UPI0019D68B16|nr:zinc finger BED domain-containing protein RICESLEEPER 1-like isoform X2 [Panicum virgatum]